MRRWCSSYLQCVISEWCSLYSSWLRRIKVDVSTSLDVVFKELGLIDPCETRESGACCLVDDLGEVLGFGDAGCWAPTEVLFREVESLDIMDGEGRALKFLRKLFNPLT